MACNPYPCGCCEPCDNYYDPNEWYHRFCYTEQIYTGYANRVGYGGFTPARSWYWGANSMASDIAGLLVNFQYSSIFSTAGNTRTYRADVPVSSLDRTLDLYYGDTADPEGSYVSKPIVFANTFVRVDILDTCGVWRSIATIYSDITTADFGTVTLPNAAHTDQSYWRTTRSSSSSTPIATCVGGQDLHYAGGTSNLRMSGFLDSGGFPVALLFPVRAISSTEALQTGLTIVNNSLALCPDDGGE